MKKNFFGFFVLTAFLCVSGLTAQVSVDPCDDFYTAAAGWYVRGVVNELPPVQPYPLPGVWAIPGTVQQSGSISDAAAASSYYKRIFGKPWNISATIEEKNVFSKNAAEDDTSENFRLKGSLLGYGNILFNDVLSAGYRTGAAVTAFDLSAADFTDKWTPERYDTISTGIQAGGTEISFTGDCMAYYSTDKVTVAAGYNRIGFGPFLDGGNVLNQYAQNAPQALVVLNGKHIDFTQYFAALESTDVNGKNGRYGKFLTFHSLRAAVGSKTYVSFYDAVVYSGRFDPSYLIPVPSILIDHSNGNGDNLLSGMLFEYKLQPGISWNTDVTIDYIDYLKLMKLKLTGDYRAAVKTGLTYAPTDSLCDIMTIDYTVITPFTYSYGSTGSGGSDYTASFTNGGTSMGLQLPSNSDQIAMQIRLTPMRNLKVTTLVSIAHHANAYESLSDSEADAVFTANKNAGGTDSVYATDGSVYTVYAGDIAQLLSQDHIMTICRGGIKMAYGFHGIPAGALTLNSEFTFTYVHNAGVDMPMYSGSAATRTDSYNQWVKQLHDEYNTYLTFSVVYNY